MAINATAILACVAAAKLLLQFAGIRHYGIFRDELYYLACGEHLAWGYVDQPPLIAGVAWLARHALGNSLVAIRILPALAGALVVLLTGVLAHEFGGGRFAQFLASALMADAIAVVVVPDVNDSVVTPTLPMISSVTVEVMALALKYRAPGWADCITSTLTGM